MHGREWRQLRESLWFVRAVCHGDARHTSISRKLEIVRRVANHQRLARRRVQPRHQVQQHVRVRLGESLVGTARGMEARDQPALREDAVKSGARLARRHSQ